MFIVVLKHILLHLSYSTPVHVNEQLKSKSKLKSKPKPWPNRSPLTSHKKSCPRNSRDYGKTWNPSGTFLLLSNNLKMTNHGKMTNYLIDISSEKLKQTTTRVLMGLSCFCLFSLKRKKIVF